MGKFVIKTGKDKQFYFNLKAGNDETILSSEGYTTRTSCKRGIASVMKNAGEATRYETLTSKSGKLYFVLRAANKKVIGRSEMYESPKACAAGITSIKKNAPGAIVEDEKK